MGILMVVKLDTLIRYPIEDDCAADEPVRRVRRAGHPSDQPSSCHRHPIDTWCPNEIEILHRRRGGGGRCPRDHPNEQRDHVAIFALRVEPRSGPVFRRDGPDTRPLSRANEGIAGPPPEVGKTVVCYDAFVSYGHASDQGLAPAIRKVPRITTGCSGGHRRGGGRWSALSCPQC